MSLRQVTPPTTLPVTLAEAKANMRVTIADDDAFISATIGAALAYAEKTTGRAFESQTWELSIDRFPAGEIMLPFGPVVSVTSVTYTDADGIDQIVSAVDYEVDTASQDGWVVPSTDWPTPMTTINAVRVLYEVGSGTPADVKQAILLIVGHWYNQRETASAPAMAEIPLGAEAILSLHRRIYC